MREEVDLSLTIPSKILGKRDREKKGKEEKNKNKKKRAKKQQKDPILLTSATHKFLPALTMPYGEIEIGDDFRSLDCDADVSSDIHLSSSSSFYSFSSSSSSLCTDDPSSKMEKDPRKIARRFDFSRLCEHLSELAFSSLFACLRFSTDGVLSLYMFSAE